MNQRINITESEWKVMLVLWEMKYPLTLKEIVAALYEENQWSTTTVRTLIVRLMEKGAIEADKTIANFKYNPLLAKEDCQLKEATNFLNRVFNGSMGMLVSTFAKQSNLSIKEQEELLRMIEKLESGKEE